MGKRELVLIAVFLVAGVVAFQLLAPPGRSSGVGEQLSRAFDEIRSDLAGDAARAERRAQKALFVPRSAQELRIVGFRGTLTILGEEREDAAAELLVVASGADEARARANADQVALNLSASGGTVTVGLQQPQRVRRLRTELTLKVPARLRVTVEVIGPLRLERVAAADIAVTGDTIVRGVPGSIRVDHRNGRLEMTSVGPLRLLGRMSEVRLDGIHGESSFDLTGGRLTVGEIAAEARIEARRTEIEVARTGAPLTVNVTDERITVNQAAAPVRIEGRRAEVTLTLAAPVPVSAATTDEQLEVRLPANGGVTVDAIAVSGAITVGAASIKVTGDRETEQRAEGPVGGGGPVLTLRTMRGDMVIR